MKNAIGTLEKCLSELDIKRRRLIVLSWMPSGGKTQEMRPSFTDTPDFLNAACAATCDFGEPADQLRLAVGFRSALFEIARDT